MAAKKKKVSKEKIGTRRSSLKKKRQVNKFQSLFVWGRRLVVVCVSLMLVVWVGALFFLSEADITATKWVVEKTRSVTIAVGFRVENILVEGREYSDPDVLLALINVEKGDSIFSLNPKEAKKQIERISWIKSARVERRLPDTVYVRLQERHPVALWQDGGALSLIDSEGEILTQQGLDQFKDLLMIRGKGAPEKSENLMALLESEPELKLFVDHAEYIEKRRWDLYLKDGKRIKLPEDDIGLALRNVMLRQEQDKILSKKSITIIDARYQGRLIVRTKLGKVQDYKAGIIDAGARL